MDKMKNPFTPGAGFMPPELAGRQGVLENGCLVAQRTKMLRAERGMMMIGPRGVGKTALLKYLAEQARRDGIVPVFSEVRDDGRVLEELSVKLQEALSTLDFVSKVKSTVREAFAVLTGFIQHFALHVGSIGVEVEARGGLGASGDMEFDLSEVLLSAARAAKDAGTAIGLYLDELQNMDSEPLSGIVVALHHAAQDMLPLYLIGSGLPTIRAVIGKSKTYAERMFTYEEIGPLTEEASRDAIRNPIRNAGAEIDDRAVREIYAASRGYPFFLQELGYVVWQQAASSPISFDAVADSLPLVFRRLDANFFDVRLDRVAPSERRFLRAMADVGGTGGAGVALIAEALHKQPNAISMTRRSLIRKGMVYAPRAGYLDYTVPMFAEYIRRVMPSTDAVCIV